MPDEVLCSDGTGGGCGKPITGPRVSPHGRVDVSKHIQGSDFDVLEKQAGYRPNEAYGTGGTWSPPLLMHLDCARAAGLPTPDV